MTWPYYLTLVLGHVEQDYYSATDKPETRDPYEQAALEQDFMAILRGEVSGDPTAK